MRFGYFTLTDNPAGYGDRRRDPSQFVREVLAEAVLAEELGFHSVWLPEHHFGLFGCLPTPAQFLSYVAARTTRVRLAPGTVVLPINHPLRVAEEYAALDLLSNGRAVFCAGRGFDRREYQAFGVPLEESRERFDEALALVRTALSDEQFTFAGRFYPIAEPITVLPRPVQRPHPPMYVACFSRPTVEMAARGGYHAIFAPFAAAMMFGSLQQAADEFRALAHAAGHSTPRVMCSYFVAVTDSAAETRAAQERLLFYLRAVTPANLDPKANLPPNLAYMADIARRVQTMQPEHLGERSIVAGDAARCVEVFKQVEAAGIEEVVLYFNYGAYGHADTVRQMERFARDVLPHFSAAPAPAGA
ncbi:MAG TPA: LLM class flavin-dependent oxidoreductase [Chloroflexota bacterium]|nr:LLM class flavin-dependent oxidoreductase [Chloroflexota bacterium]